MEEVKTKFKALKQSWKKFEHSHKKLHDILTEYEEIDESHQYYDKEVNALCSLKQKIAHWVSSVETSKKSPLEIYHEEIEPEDSVSQVSSVCLSKVSKVSKVSSTGSSSSSVRRMRIEETANRKALEAKLRLFEQEQILAEKKLQLQKQVEQEERLLEQQEEVLKMKVELAQCAAREEVYAQEEACERGEMIYNKRPLKEMIETSAMPMVKVETKDSPLNPMATEWPEKIQDNSTPLKSPKKELDKSFMKQDSFVKIITIQERQTKCTRKACI